MTRGREMPAQKVTPLHLFLERMLQWETHIRASAEELLQDPWLQAEDYDYDDLDVARAQ